MLKTTALIKGVGIGIIAGTAITASVLPIDKRRFARSKAGRACRSISSTAQNFVENFKE